MDTGENNSQNIRNLSMYNKPASGTTRSVRKISDKTFRNIIDTNNKTKGKRKKTLENQALKSMKTESGVIKNWANLSKI